MKKCTCNKEDGIHEWDCAIEVEKRNRLLDRMAPFFGLEKKKEAHGFRWAEKSSSTKSRRTPLAPDLGWVCGKCRTHNADGVSLCGFCDTPRLSG